MNNNNKISFFKIFVVVLVLVDHSHHHLFPLHYQTNFPVHYKSKKNIKKFQSFFLHQIKIILREELAKKKPKNSKFKYYPHWIFHNQISSIMFTHKKINQY
jgi:hypothetical protein